MERGVGFYFFLAILVGLAFFLAYFFNLPLTGFVVFDESVSGFNGTFENVAYNGSAVVLNSGQTSGTYTSEIFDANDSTQWNTLTWQGGIPTEDNSVTNESGFINSTGYTLSGFDSSWSGLTLTALYDATDNSVIGLGNATLDSASGVVTNATANEYNNVLISYDYVSPSNASLSFQVRACDTPDCANVSFASADLSDIRLLGQWFQYKAFFSSPDSSLSPLLENVVINSSIGIVSLTISEPNGTKSSQTGIPIQFTATGLDLNCWYNLDNGENVTLTDCSGTSFNAPDDGNYVFNLYANNSLGVFDHEFSTFSVDTPAPSSSGSEEESASELIGPTPGQIVQLTLAEVQDLTLSPSDAEQLSLSVANTGAFPINACALTALGDFASWITVLTGEQNLNPGDEVVYSFALAIPENQELGQYGLTLEVRCDTFVQKEDFLVDVVTPAPPESEPEEEIVAEEGTAAAPVGGGFAIFGEDGIIGTGGAIILVIVVLALVAVLFGVRMMRKSGKTLRDVFNNLEGVFNNFRFRYKKPEW